jgi:hypothetical protein
MLAHIIVISVNFNSENGNIYWQNTDGSPWRLCSGLWQITSLTQCILSLSYLAVTIEILQKCCRMKAADAVTVSFLHSCHS